MKIKRWLTISYIIVILSPVISGLILFNWINQYNKEIELKEYLYNMEKFEEYEDDLMKPELYRNYNQKYEIVKENDKDYIKIKLYDRHGYNLYSSVPNDFLFNMDTKGIAIFLALTAIIIIYLKDIKELIIPTKKSKLEIATVVISTIVIIGIMYLYGETWFHYLIGFLGIIFMIVTLPRRGITIKGFRSNRGIYWGNWNKLKSVHVITINEDVKVSLTGRYLYWDTHYYKKEDYDKIINILQENLDDNYTIDHYFNIIKINESDRHKLIKAYSQGMKNKLQMLMFVITKPPVILLDEPLTSLDVVVALEIKRLLRDMRKDHIIIFSTHILQLARDLCDEIVILNEGQLSLLEKEHLNNPNFEDEIIELLKEKGTND